MSHTGDSLLKSGMEDFTSCLLPLLSDAMLAAITLIYWLCRRLAVAQREIWRMDLIHASWVVVMEAPR